MSVYEVPSATASRVPGRQVVTEKVQRYSAMFETFLSERGRSVEPSGASSDCVYLTYLSGAEQWRQFIARLCDAYSQVCRIIQTDRQTLLSVACSYPGAIAGHLSCVCPRGV